MRHRYRERGCGLGSCGDFMFWGDRMGRHRLNRSANGKFLGVCHNIANRFDLPVKGVRLVVILAAIFTGFWPVFALYMIAALIMKPTRFSSEEAKNYRRTRSSTVNDIKRSFDDLNGRLSDMEDAVIAKEFDWERRYNQSR